MAQNGTSTNMIKNQKYFALPNSKDNSRCIASCVGGIINAHKGKGIYINSSQLDEQLFRSPKIIERTIQPAAAYVLANAGLNVVMNVPMPISWYKIYRYGIKIMNINAVNHLKKNFNINNYEKAVKLTYEKGVKMRNNGYKDIKKIIKQHPNSFFMAGVNPFLLYDKNSNRFGGHYILILGLQNNKLVISDPGLPYRKKTEINLSNFNLAWKNNHYKTGELIIATP